MTQVKISGITCLEDVAAVNAARPDYVGFVFDPNSKYCITREEAIALKEALAPGIQIVGMFAQADQVFIRSLVTEGIIHLPQLDGDETDFYEILLQTSMFKPVARTVRPKTWEELNQKDIASVSENLFLDLCGKDGCKADFGYEKLEKMRHTFFLCGDIDEENVCGLIDLCHPVGVDISVGVETDGKKDAEKIARIIRKIRNHEATPEDRGLFGSFGGQYAESALIPALQELESAFILCKKDPQFQEDFNGLLIRCGGRPAPLYFAKRMTEELKGASIYFKREDLNPIGSHHFNSAMGQALLAKYMGKTHLITDTVSGQNGVACAAAAAQLGLTCEVHMTEEDMRRQPYNLARMTLLGAQLCPAPSLPLAAQEEALIAWEDRTEDALYVASSATGPHPYPSIVRDFQRTIGRELKLQTKKAAQKLPDVVIAPVGGGACALGAFYDLFNEKGVRLVGCQPAGNAPLTSGVPAIFNGMKSLFCADEEGEFLPSRTIAPDLSSPCVGPELAYMTAIQQVEAVSVSDVEAVAALQYLARTEGILISAEAAHAVACAKRLAPTMAEDKVIVVVLSGSGDKDAIQAASWKLAVEEVPEEAEKAPQTDEPAEEAD